MDFISANFNPIKLIFIYFGKIYGLIASNLLDN